MVDEFDRLKKRTSNGDVPFDINDINSFEKVCIPSFHCSW